jgi:hypothetical protein
MDETVRRANFNSGHKGTGDGIENRELKIGQW